MEGPLVHWVADELQFLEGQKIEKVRGNAKQPKEKLQGNRIEDVRAVKKRLFIDAGEVVAVIHFLMFGSYSINRRREDLDERLSLVCSRDEVNFYNCSVKVLEKAEREYNRYDEPSVDVLSGEFDKERAFNSIRRSPRAIADVLLDQNIFGGVGNIIKNEVLFKTGIHPESRAASIPEEKARDLLEAVVDWSRSWYDHQRSGKSKEFEIYRKGSCTSCGSEIRRKKLGEHDRISFFCEKCQEKHR